MEHNENGDDFMRPVDWWTAANDEITLDRLLAFYDKVRNDDVGRLELLNRHVRMYGNLPVSNSGITKFGTGWGGEDRIRLNVVKAACDMVTAKITKNKPLPEPTVSGGNWSMDRKARFLRQFFRAQFYLSDITDVSTDVFLDAAITGTGAMKLYAMDGEIHGERIYPGELFIDEMDGLERKPRMVIQRKFIDRKVLQLKFPKHKKVIAIAGQRVDHGEENTYEDRSDHVLVLEAWRRPTKKNGKDGRHVIIVDNATLLREDWSNPLPFVFLRWTKRPRGFWGVGLAEELTGIQVEINRLLQKIQAAMHLVSVPRVFVEEGSRVLKAFLNNKIGMVVPYRGQKPIFEVPQAIHPEMFQHLNWLYQKAFEIAGISMLGLGSGKPAELSGVALSTYHDIESERFATVSISWERMHLAIADHMIRLAKEIGGKFTLHSDRYTIDRVDWSEIDMDRDAFVLKVESTSALPSTPAGRLNFVSQMIQGGILTDTKRAQRLMQLPDLERDASLEEAAERNIARILELILDEGEYEAPEPYLDLELALKMGQARYNMAVQFKDIPEEHLDHLRRWLNQVHVMMEAALLRQQQLSAQPTAGTPPAGSPPPVGTQGVPPTAVTASDGAVNV